MSHTVSRARMTGIGRVLVIVYAVMALAATGRSFVQIVRRFDDAPLAYTLSAIAARGSRMGSAGPSWPPGFALS